jgi:site-specific recombinase XerD
MYIQQEGQGQQDRAYYNFINSCKSEDTREKYYFNVRDFMRFCQVTRHSELLKINAGEKIIDYIVHLRNQKLSSHTIHSKLTAIYHFYTMNNMLLTKVKLNKYKGEFRKVKKERAYTREEIHKLLDIAGLRMKVCILLMASAGLLLGLFLQLKSNISRGLTNTIYTR